MDGYREARARLFSELHSKRQGPINIRCIKGNGIRCQEKKNYHECDQAQEQVGQNIKNINAYTSVANASFTQQMSPSVDHVF